jgi:hypothetical protein
VKLPVVAIQALTMTVGLLVRGQYEVLERMTQGKRMPAEEMARAISEYGRRLKLPPPEAYADLRHVTEREWACGRFCGPGEGRHAYYVEFPLWTVEEGQSDLELVLVLVEVMDDVYGVELHDIRIF